MHGSGTLWDVLWGIFLLFGILYFIGAFPVL